MIVWTPKSAAKYHNQLFYIHINLEYMLMFGTANVNRSLTAFLVLLKVASRRASLTSSALASSYIYIYIYIYQWLVVTTWNITFIRNKLLCFIFYMKVALFRRVCVCVYLCACLCVLVQSTLYPHIHVTTFDFSLTSINVKTLCRNFRFSICRCKTLS